MTQMIQIKFNTGGFLSVLLTLTLVSCSSVPQEQTAAEKNIADAKAAHEKYQAAQAAPEIPAEISDSLLNNALNSAEPPAAEQRFDISVNQVPARTFFLSLVSDSGVNVVAHPEISGNISLELKNVTVREALDVTREVYGYEYKYQNRIYTIYPRKLRTEVFPINYLDIKRVGLTDTSVSIGKVMSGSSNNNNRSNNSSSSQYGNSQGQESLLGYLDGQENKSSRNSRSSSSPGARVQTLNKTDFWNSVHETVSAIVGGEEGGRMVMTNPQAGLIVVKAMPTELNAVRDFLERSELSIRRQVVLETKIIEVKLNDDYEAGIDWGAIGGSLKLETENSRTRVFSNTGKQLQDVSDQLFSSVLNVVDITQLLNLLETQGNVQVLSSPRISTVNNQKAVIRVGSDEFFVTGVSNSTTTSASTIQNIPEVELDSFFSGIALDVTPQIAEDGDVILHVHPIVTKVEDQIKEITFGEQLYSLPLALRDIRESDSVVRASSGEVVVLGGLMQETTVDVAKKNPVLGDIPVVNLMFKQRRKEQVKTELVILMRPVVVDENTWNDEIERSDLSIKALSDAYRSRND